MGKHYTPDDIRLIETVLSSSTNKEAAEKLDISVSTLRRLKQDPRYQAAVKTFLNAITENVLQKMKLGSGKAIETLQSILDDESTTPQVKINGIQLYFNVLFRLTEVNDFESRISALEELNEKDYGW